MKNNIKRFFKFSTKFLLIISCFLLLFIYILLFTQPGLNFAYYYFHKKLPITKQSSINIGSLSGRLIGPITAQNISYTQDKIHISIEAAFFDWSFKDLILKKTAHIKFLHTNKMVITYKDDKNLAQSFDLQDYLLTKNHQNLNLDQPLDYAKLRLPIAITIDDVMLKNTTLNINSYIQEINEAKINIVKEKNIWKINNISLAAPNFKIVSNGTIYSVNNILKGKLDFEQLNFNYINNSSTSINANDPNHNRSNNINLTGSISTKIDFNNNTSRFRISNLYGTWLDEAFALETQLILQDTTIKDIDLKGAFEHNNFFFKAIFDTDLYATWKLEIPVLNKLFKQYNGSINLTGDIEKNSKKDSITAQASIHIENIIPKFSLNINGTTDNFTNKLTLNKGGFYITSDSVATKEAQNSWLLNFKNSTILIDEVASFKLVENSKLKFLDNKFIFDNFCIANQQSSACLNATINDDLKWTATLDGKDIFLNLFSTLLPGNIKLTGDINFNSTLSGEGLKLDKLNSNLNLNMLNLDYEDIGNDTYTIPLHSGNVSLSLDNELKIATELKFNANNSLAGNLNLDLRQLHLNHLPIDGKLNLDFNSINTIYSAQKNKTNSGALTAAIKLAGTFAEPQINNQLSLTNLDINLGYLKNNLRIKQLIITDLNHNRGEVKGVGSLGPGNFTFFGNTSYAKHTWGAGINLTGNNLELINTYQYHIFASPDVKVNFENRRLDIKGKIKIDSGLINWNDNIDSITSSEDIEFIDEKKSNSWFNLYSLIDFSIPSDISFEGYGLTANLSGNVKIKSAPNISALANGNLVIKNGTYLIYGKSFNLDEGRLFFPGNSIYKPHIDIAANKIITARSSIDNPLINSSNELKVGAKVTNTLDNVKIKLFSDPELPENDIVSYLLIGKSAQDAAKNVILTAVQQIGSAILTKTSKKHAVNEKNNATSTPKKTKNKDFVLFDSVKLVEKNNLLGDSINTNSSEFENILSNVNLVISNKLARRWILDVELSALAYNSVLRLKYELNNNFSVQTSANLKGAGLDLLFNKESD